MCEISKKTKAVKTFKESKKTFDRTQTTLFLEKSLKKELNRNFESYLVYLKDFFQPFNETKKKQCWTDQIGKKFLDISQSNSNSIKIL